MAFTLQNAKDGIIQDAESLIERGLFFKTLADEDIDDSETPETLVALFLSDGIDEADDIPENQAQKVLRDAHDVLMTELKLHLPDYFDI
jgi:hypothetical protein